MTLTELEANLAYLREKCAFLSEVLECMQSFEVPAIRFDLKVEHFNQLEKHVADELLKTITELDIYEADMQTPGRLHDVLN